MEGTFIRGTTTYMRRMDRQGVLGYFQRGALHNRVHATPATPVRWIFFNERKYVAQYHAVPGCLKCSGCDKRPRSLTRHSLDSLNGIVGNKYHLVVSELVPVATISTTGRSKRVDHD